MSATIRERLGDSTMEALVDRLYELAAADPLTRQFFDNPDSEGNIEQRRRFSRMALGAAEGDHGWDLRKIHAPFVARGLDNHHFNAFIGHLASTLEELKVPGDLAAEIVAKAEGARDEVLGR